MVAEGSQLVSAGFPRFVDAFNIPSDFKEFGTHMFQFDHRVVTSATVASVVVTPNILASFLTAIAGTPLGNKLDKFSYSTSKLKVKIVVQGAPYAAGQIVASFEPCVGLSPDFTYADGPGNSTKVSCKIVPHLIIDPSKTETYEIVLPVCTPYGVWDMNAGGSGSYKMNFVFFNPIFSGTAVAPSVAICTYIGFEKEEFQGLTLLSGAFEEEKKPGGFLSNAAKSVSKYANLLAVPFPALSPEITLFSKVAGTAGDFLAYLGFSKPPQLDAHAIVNTRLADNYSQFDGTSTAIVLAGSQANSVGISSKHGGGNDDELLISHLAAMRALVRQFSVAPAAANGALIGIVRLHPTSLGLFAGGAEKCVTPLGGVAAPFAYWMGDLEVTIEVVASVFHRCTILAAWDPRSRADDLAPSISDAMQVLHNTVITVAGNTSVTVHVPWAQARLWADVCGFVDPQTNANVPVRCTNGSMYFYVVNPLTSNGSTDSIAINVYLSSKNIKFAAPSVERLPPSIIWMDGVPPSVTLLSAEFVEDVPVSFGPRTDLDQALLRSFGEEYVSIKQLTSKLTSQSQIRQLQNFSNPYFKWDSRVAPFIKGGSNEFASTPAVACTSYMTYMGWFASAYVGYRGSIRHSFHIHSTLLLTGLACIDPSKRHTFAYTSVVTTPYAGGAGGTNFLVPTDAGRGYAFTEGNREVSPNIDFVTPTMITGDFIPRGDISHARQYASVAVGMSDSPINAGVVIEHYAGTGDDANFVWFVGFPPVT